jgi:chemotaxis signal transduction protein
MHVIVWTAGQLQYAVDSRQVQEVIPVVQARTIPGLPAWCRGVIEYRQQLIPLLDGPALLDQPATPPRMCNRILVLRPAGDEPVPTEPAPASPAGALAGLLVESVIDTADLDFEGESSRTRLRSAAADFLGPLVRTARGTIQLLDPLKLPRIEPVVP